MSYPDMTARREAPVQGAAVDGAGQLQLQWLQARCRPGAGCLLRIHKQDAGSKCLLLSSLVGDSGAQLQRRTMTSRKDGDLSREREGRNASVESTGELQPSRDPELGGHQGMEAWRLQPGLQALQLQAKSWDLQYRGVCHFRFDSSLRTKTVIRWNSQFVFANLLACYLRGGVLGGTA